MKHSVIALTGGIGSGKSAVGNYLREKSFTVIDCDKLSREVSTHPQVLQQVANLLGNEYVIDGKLDRAKIRSVVFGNKRLHDEYSKIFHERIKQMLVECVSKSNGTVFVEIPLLDAFDFEWDQIWLVERDVESRVNAVVTRDNVTAQNVLEIVSKQAICTNFTVKIDNNGTLEELFNQVDNLVKRHNLL